MKVNDQADCPPELDQCFFCSTDKLSGISMKSDQQPPNKAAARYGYVRVGVSTPDVNWVFGFVLKYKLCQRYF